MQHSIQIGLGFRRDLTEELLETEVFHPDFIELAPENWIDLGGYWRKVLERAAYKFPITAHGLSLSLGSPEELDWDLLRKIKKFLADFKVDIYSEHLSYTKSANAHLYDLLPIPFREDAVKHVAQRIKVVQDFLEQPLALENVSYYTPVGAEMDEATFLSSILNEADCKLLLDVNNVYVNAFNHGYDPKVFIESLPLNRVAYIHMAGHDQVATDLIIDTHGQAIVDPVYDLFAWTLERVSPVKVLLERDFNFPEAEVLQEELQKLRTICNRYW